jgi:hypothetical protein
MVVGGELAEGYFKLGEKAAAVLDQIIFPQHPGETDTVWT